MNRSALWFGCSGVVVTLVACGGLSTEPHSGRAASDDAGPSIGRDAAPDDVDATGPSGNVVTGGSLGGEPFVARAARARPTRGRNGDQQTTVGYAIVISDAPVCVASDVANSRLIGIQVETVGDSLSAGDYPIATELPLNTNGLTLASYTFLDATCHERASARAIAGVITIVAVTPGAVRGRFELSFEQGEPVTGSFDARICDAPSGVPQCL